MTNSVLGSERATQAGRHRPFGGFLDRVPAGLYAAAHVAFLAAGASMWLRAHGEGLDYGWAFALYALSQIGFLAYFARWITMKTAVLAEQTLVLVLLLVVVLATT